MKKDDINPQDNSAGEKPKISSWDLEEEISSSSKTNKNFFKLGIIFLVITLVSAGIFFFLFLNSSPKKAPAQEKQTTTTTKAPKKAELNKSEWTLEVLNGSGVAGSAAKAAAKLTELGYTVVKTDNADNQDYKKNELFVAENMQSKAQLLIDDLKSNYGFSSVSGVLKDPTASARIIIGSD